MTNLLVLMNRRGDGETVKRQAMGGEVKNEEIVLFRTMPAEESI